MRTEVDDEVMVVRAVDGTGAPFAGVVDLNWLCHKVVRVETGAIVANVGCLRERVEALVGNKGDDMEQERSLGTSAGAVEVSVLLGENLFRND